RCGAFPPPRGATLLFAMFGAPAVFPGFNLMTDIPAQGFALAAIATFRRAACSRTRESSAARRYRSLALAVLAGILAALAAQTKYTGFLCLAVIGAYAATGQPSAATGRALPVSRCPRRSLILLALLSIMTALVLFCSWEIFIAGRHGESHFLFHLRNQASATGSKMHLIMPLLTLLGYLAPGLV